MGVYKELSQIKVNEAIHGCYLVQEISVKTATNGSPFLSCKIADKKTSIPCKFWDYSGDITSDANGEILFISGAVQEYKGAKQIILNVIRPATKQDGYDAEDLIPSAPGDIAEMLNTITNLLSSIRDPDYSKLVEKLYAENVQKFTISPAAKKVHHAFLHGLLMHTSDIMRAAAFYANGSYKNFVNYDLLLAGAFCHDLGKLREFDLAPTGLVADYSISGKLLGHLYIGATMVADAAKELGLPEKKVILLQHLILSHHGEPQYGAAVLPQCPEAELLSYIDMSDAKLEIYREAFNDMEPNTFTETSPFGLSHRIYKA